MIGIKTVVIGHSFFFMLHKKFGNTVPSSSKESVVSKLL